jgi:hypothetical protein
MVSCQWFVVSAAADRFAGNDGAENGQLTTRKREHHRWIGYH